jgi:hypothetical protein
MNMYTMKTARYGTIILEELKDVNAMVGHTALKVVYVERSPDLNHLHVGYTMSYETALLKPFTVHTIIIPLIL